MKIKWKGTLLAFALAFGTAAAAPGPDGTALAVDFDKACTLTVHPGGGDSAGDLAGAGVVIDLYKVADAVPVDGQDTYTYSFLEDYAGLKPAGQPDSAQWEALAQSAAEAALNGGVPVITGEPAGARISVPGSGLYLVVARGKGIRDYTAAAQGGRTATIARSDAYTYAFTPSLVSLPGREADAGGWVYDVDVTLKPERSERYGSLEIVKTLQSYETKDPATFVFQVEAVLDGQKVYSDVVSLSFTAPGQKSELVGKLPVGAEVTVREIYSGAAYTLVTADTQTAVITADGAASVAFANGYDGSGRGGGAVTNRFDYSPDSGWAWTKITDDE